jgi:nucleoid DNA-binding protein
MTKDEFIKSVSAETGFSQKEVAKIWSSCTEKIKNTVIEGGRINFPEIGSFRCKHRPGRTGRHPQSGDQIQIPAKNIVEFNPSKYFKEEVANTGAAIN